MNQQLIFNNDFRYDSARDAVQFSCLLAGLRIDCFIRRPAGQTGESWLAQVKQQAFSWEDQAEQVIAEQAFTVEGELWLPV